MTAALPLTFDCHMVSWYRGLVEDVRHGFETWAEFDNVKVTRLVPSQGQ